MKKLNSLRKIKVNLLLKPLQLKPLLQQRKEVKMNQKNHWLMSQSLKYLQLKNM
jgi:hypothetical protein